MPMQWNQEASSFLVSRLLPQVFVHEGTFAEQDLTPCTIWRDSSFHTPDQIAPCGKAPLEGSCSTPTNIIITLEAGICGASNHQCQFLFQRISGLWIARPGSWLEDVLRGHA